ncbi:saccharopine dehydrogenase family protein [Archangium lansingense]|uniref:saccharopine dehydrogenase family protein n=1 Tax=Archangium lansingense TaxID=2995310 RepID=UPI003B7CB3D8
MSGEPLILIVGGYGQVGQAVARFLSPIFPGQVVIAGRSRMKAEAFAATLGGGAQATGFELTAGRQHPLLARARLVIMCVDQDGTELVEHCLAAGIDYIDVTAKQESLTSFERLDSLARRSGSTALLSVGVAPGLTNLLAAHAARQFDRVGKMDLFLMLGAGDEHGEAAIGWMLDNLDEEFDVFQDGRLRRVRGFGEHARVRFPGSSQERRAYRFNFPDQRVVARTLTLPTVSTWMCFDSALLTSMVGLASRLRLSRLLRRPIIRRGAIRSLRAVHLGSEDCAILARAEGLIGTRPATREFALSGRREAELTGLVAAEVARLLLSGHRPGGVLHVEQFVQPGDFLRRLSAVRPGLQLWL